MVKRSYRWINYLPFCFIAFCGFIMSLNATNNPFHIGNMGTDSSVFTYVAEVIVRGGMPYRDTFDHKGPLIYLIDALGLLINEQVGIWFIEVFAILVSFTFTYKIARIVGCNQPAACIAVAVNVVTLTHYFEGGNLVEEYASAFISISFYIFLKFFLTGSTKPVDLIVCGASFSAVCLLRINMIAIWIVMCIGVLIDRINGNKAKELLRFIAWFFVGAVLFAAPIIIWLIKNGAFSAFINDYFIFNFMYSSDQDRASAINVLSAFLHFSCGEPVILGAPPLLYFCIKEKKLIDWLTLLFLVVSLLLMCISGQTYEHYGMILCPIITYAVAKLLLVLTPFFKRREKREVIAISLSLVAAFTLLFARTGYTLAISVAKAVIRYNPLTDNQKIAEVVRANTSIEDTISVCGNRDIIYLLSGRESSSKYSYQAPIAKVNPQIREEYLNDIRTKRAKIIIIDTGSSLYDDITSIITGDYRTLSTIGTTILYIRLQ